MTGLPMLYHPETLGPHRILIGEIMDTVYKREGKVITDDKEHFKELFGGCGWHIDLQSETSKGKLVFWNGKLDMKKGETLVGSACFEGLFDLLDQGVDVSIASSNGLYDLTSAIEWHERQDLPRPGWSFDQKKLRYRWRA